MSENDVQKQFGRRVRQLRKARGLTQEELAEAIGRTVDTVSNIERGFSSTRLKTAAELAAILKVPLADLFVPRPSGAEDLARQQLLDRFKEIAKGLSRPGLEAMAELIEGAARLAGQPPAQTKPETH